jgi:hypothetical protein
VETGAGVGEGGGGGEVGSVDSGEVGGTVSVGLLEVGPVSGGWVGAVSAPPPATAVWVAIMASSASKVLMALSGVSVTGGGVDADSLQPASNKAEVTITMKII